jgi:hypothetical protein
MQAHDGKSVIVTLAARKLTPGFAARSSAKAEVTSLSLQVHAPAPMLTKALSKRFAAV